MARCRRTARRHCRRSEEHTSELQSRENLVCRLLLEKKKHSLHLSGSPYNNYTLTLDGYGLFFWSLCDLSEGVYVAKMQGVDVFFFFNDTATTEIYTLSLHDALPI